MKMPLGALMMRCQSRLNQRQLESQSFKQIKVQPYAEGPNQIQGRGGTVVSEKAGF